MVNFGPNDRDARDRENDPIEARTARRGQQGGNGNQAAANDRAPDDALGDPVESREEGGTQHGRKGQAQSPKQSNHFEPPKEKEGH